MSKRAILYARVSTPQQATLYSLDYQIEQERSYAHDLGFEIVAEFKDDQSGRKMERDGLSEARKFLVENKADVLITWKLDRLHRSYINTVLLRDEIQKLGKELHYAQMRQKSGTTAKQRLPEDILALLAEIEADEIVERTSMGRRQKALSGKWIGFNKPPFGYRSVGKSKDATIEVIEEQAVIIKLIFQWYVYGEPPDPPMSGRQVADKLTALGIPTPEDMIEVRKPQKKNGYAVWPRTAINRILRESAYMGTYYHFRHKNKDGKGNNVTNFNKEEYVGVPFPPIVDAETIRLAGEKLTAGRKMSKRNTKHEYLLSRRVWCKCGHKMSANTGHTAYHRLDGVVNEYIYDRYQCVGRRKETIQKCDQKDIRVKVLDDRVWQFIREEIANPEALERKLREIQEEQQKQKTPITDRLVTLQAHRDEIIEELRRLALLYAKKQMPEHLLDDLIIQGNHKLQLTEEAIDKAEKDAQEPLSDEVIENLVSFSEDFQARLETVEKSFASKRTIVDGLEVTVTVINTDSERWLKITTLLHPQGVFRTLSPTP